MVENAMIRQGKVIKIENATHQIKIENATSRWKMPSSQKMQHEERKFHQDRKLFINVFTQCKEKQKRTKYRGDGI